MDGGIIKLLFLFNILENPIDKSSTSSKIHKSNKASKSYNNILSTNNSEDTDIIDNLSTESQDNKCNNLFINDEDNVNLISFELEKMSRSSSSENLNLDEYN